MQLTVVAQMIASPARCSRKRAFGLSYDRELYDHLLAAAVRADSLTPISSRTRRSSSTSVCSNTVTGLGQRDGGHPGARGAEVPKVQRRSSRPSNARPSPSAVPTVYRGVRSRSRQRRCGPSHLARPSAPHASPPSIRRTPARAPAGRADRRRTAAPVPGSESRNRGRSNRGTGSRPWRADRFPRGAFGS